MNVQFSDSARHVYVFGVNPRASRTVPFVSKATGVPLAKSCGALMTGKKLATTDLPHCAAQRRADYRRAEFYSVKSPVFPSQISWRRYHPRPRCARRAKSWGISTSLREDLRRLSLQRGNACAQGTVFLSVNDRDKKQLGALGKNFRHWVFGCLPPGEPLLRWKPPHRGRAGIQSERGPPEHCDL